MVGPATVTDVPAWTIRPAEASDLDAMSAILTGEVDSSWTAATLAKELDLAWSRLDVVETSAVVGFMVYWITADEIQLMYVAVDPRHRRRGVGSALMERLVEQAVAAGATQVLLELRASNIAARSLYERFGFGEIGTRPGYYRNGQEDAVVMSREVRREA